MPVSGPTELRSVIYNSTYIILENNQKYTNYTGFNNNLKMPFYHPFAISQTYSLCHFLIFWHPFAYILSIIIYITSNIKRIFGWFELILGKYYIQYSTVIQRLWKTAHSNHLNNSTLHLFFINSACKTCIYKKILLTCPLKNFTISCSLY